MSTLIVSVGAATVVKVPVTPRHEQALEYFAKLEQADAYGGKTDGSTVWPLSRLATPWKTVAVTVLMKTPKRTRLITIQPNME